MIADFLQTAIGAVRLLCLFVWPSSGNGLPRKATENEVSRKKVAEFVRIDCFRTCLFSGFRPLEFVQRWSFSAAIRKFVQDVIVRFAEPLNKLSSN